MFGNILTQAIMYFFVCVGIIRICADIWNYFTHKANTPEDMYVVLTVKNQQDTVEGMIRSVVWQNLQCKNGGVVPQVVVVNLDSVDETPSILERLAETYDFIHVMDKAGYMEWIRKMVK